MPSTPRSSKKAKPAPDSTRSTTRTLKKRNFKRKSTPMADLLEWIVSRNPLQMVIVVAIALTLVGFTIGLVVNAHRGPDLPGWRVGPQAYAQVMGGRDASSPVLALYLYEDGCQECRTFERDDLTAPAMQRTFENFDLVRVDVSADASSSAIGQIYAPKHYPALFILRPPPHPARQVHLHDASHDWLSTQALVNACNWAVTWPDVAKGGIVNSGEDQP